MAKIISFPILTTDGKASESTEGLCPTLSSNVGLTGSPNSVNSEYGIRLALDEHCQNQISGINLGGGAEVFKQYIYDSPNNTPEIQLRSIKANSSRFTISELSGNINIHYNGNPAIQYTTSGKYVQGGSKQLTNSLGGYSTFPYSNSLGGNLYTVSGLCTDFVEVCANMQNTSLATNPTLSSEALYHWNTDISIGKLAVRIPLENSFPIANQVIWLGNKTNNKYYGYFKTKTSTQISNSGEWIDFVYSNDMYNKQYNYITTPDKITLYTSGITVYSVAPGAPVTGTVGRIDLRTFYDQVVYGGDTIEDVTLDSSVNDQSNKINKVFASRGIAHIKYYDGNYDTQYSNDLTIFNASIGSTEYYGDKDNWISVSGDVGTTVGLYIKSSSASSNNGSIQLKYNFKGL